MSTYTLGNSLWYGTTPRTSFDPVSGNESADVAIIGGGLVGLHAAYNLLKAGRKVTIYERNRIAVWASGGAAAKVAASHAYLFGNIAKYYGAKGAAQYASANLAGSARIADLIKEHNISCDYVPNDNYVYASTRKRVKRLKADLQAFEDIGLDVEWIDHISSEISPFKNFGGLVQREQATYHPRRFALALADEVIKLGGIIRERAKVTGLKLLEDHVQLTIKNEFEVAATEVIIATKEPPEFFSEYNEILNEWSATVFAFKIDEVTYPDSFFGLSKTIGSYRPAYDGKTGTKYALVTGVKPGYMKRQIGYGDVPAYHWECEDTETIDMVPLIGRVDQAVPRVYMSLGFNGWGMTTSAYSGMLLSHLIAKDNTFDSYLSKVHTQLKPEFLKHCTAAEIAAFLAPTNTARHKVWQERLKVVPKAANPQMKKVWAEK